MSDELRDERLGELGGALSEFMFLYRLDKLDLHFNPFLTGDEGHWMADAHRHVGIPDLHKRWSAVGPDPAGAIAKLIPLLTWSDGEAAPPESNQP